MAGTVIPQEVTEDRVSGAFLVDGSLRFDSTSINHLSLKLLDQLATKKYSLILFGQKDQYN